MAQYLPESVLNTNLPKFEIKSTDLISADTYNETEMLNKFNTYSDDDKKLLFKAACQIAIIGAGGRNYGSIRVSGENTVKLEDLFKRLNIKFNERINAKYDPNTLSARRLVRLLRYQIRIFIIESKRPSYLWLKYSEKNQDFIHICFPSGEHLIKNKDEAKYLLRTYINVDVRLGTRFIDRLKRTYIARGLMEPLEIETYISGLIPATTAIPITVSTAPIISK